MKVRELIKYCRLRTEQKIILYDKGQTQKTYTSVNSHAFDLDSKEVQYLLRLQVITFRCSDAGIEIYAE